MAFSSRLEGPCRTVELVDRWRGPERTRTTWKPLKTCAKTLCKDVKSEKRLGCARLLISRPGRPSKSQNDCVVRPLHHIQNRHQAECCIGSVSAGKTKTGALTLMDAGNLPACAQIGARVHVIHVVQIEADASGGIFVTLFGFFSEPNCRGGYTALLRDFLAFSRILSVLLPGILL